MNDQSRAQFVRRYGGVYEHSPWVAEQAYDAGMTHEAENAAQLHEVFSRIMRAAPAERQLALLRAHPDLAGKLALAGELTADSAKEQAAAGLDRLSASELQRFSALNEAYKTRFGFPFILAVKGADKQAILEAFERRVAHDPEQEFAAALAEVDKIALLRLKEIDTMDAGS